MPSAPRFPAPPTPPVHALAALTPLIVATALAACATPAPRDPFALPDLEGQVVLEVENRSPRPFTVHLRTRAARYRLGDVESLTRRRFGIGRFLPWDVRVEAEPPQAGPGSWISPPFSLQPGLHVRVTLEDEPAPALRLLPRSAAAAVGRGSRRSRSPARAR